MELMKADFCGVLPEELEAFCAEQCVETIFGVAFNGQNDPYYWFTDRERAQIFADEGITASIRERFFPLPTTVFPTRLDQVLCLVEGKWVPYLDSGVA